VEDELGAREESADRVQALAEHLKRRITWHVTDGDKWGCERWEQMACDKREQVHVTRASREKSALRTNGE
jgi:hypothetical protein